MRDKFMSVVGVAAPRRDRRRHGITMLEIMVSFTIFTLLGAAFMTLYVNIIGTSARVSASAVVAMDAAKAVDRLNLTLREARRYEFMDNGTSGPTGYQASVNYYVDPTPGVVDTNKDIITGIRIVHPAEVSTVTVKLPAGTAPLNGTNALKNYSVDGGSLEVYRSNKNGVPKPTDGTYLWMRGTLNGVAIPTDSQAAAGIDGKPLIENIAPWQGAVQFIQDDGGNLGKNKVRIKIVTGKVYLGGKQEMTSEQKVNTDSGTGKPLAVKAVTVYLRNQDPDSVLPNPSGRGKKQYPE